MRFGQDSGADMTTDIFLVKKIKNIKRGKCMTIYKAVIYTHIHIWTIFVNYLPTIVPINKTAL